MSCPAFERPIVFLIDLLKDNGFNIISSYNKTEVVSQIKDYIRAFNPDPEPFREATDKFLLFQDRTNAILVEVAGECSKFYMDFTPETFKEFVTFFGIIL